MFGWFKKKKKEKREFDISPLGKKDIINEEIIETGLAESPVEDIVEEEEADLVLPKHFKNFEIEYVEDGNDKKFYVKHQGNYIYSWNGNYYEHQKTREYGINYRSLKHAVSAMHEIIECLEGYGLIYHDTGHKGYRIEQWPVSGVFFPKYIKQYLCYSEGDGWGTQGVSRYAQKGKTLEEAMVHIEAMLGNNGSGGKSLKIKFS